MADRAVEHRGGLLQPPQQLAEGEVAGQDAHRLALLNVFVRELVRHTGNQDVLWLAMESAKARSGATDEDAERLWAWLKDQGSVWPEGFF